MQNIAYKYLLEFIFFCLYKNIFTCIIFYFVIPIPFYWLVTIFIFSLNILQIMNIRRISLIFFLENYTVFIYSIFKYSLKGERRLFNLTTTALLKMVQSRAETYFTIYNLY